MTAVSPTCAQRASAAVRASTSRSSRRHPAGDSSDAKQGQRSVHFAGSWLDTPVYGRDRLPVGATIAGPAIVAQLDTTILIDPGATATVDRLGNLVIAVGAAPA